MDNLIEVIDIIENAMVSAFKTNGIENIDTVEMCRVADIYKDLVNCLYWHKVILAMDSASPDEIKEMAKA